MNKGFLLSFEGVDFSAKSTQIAILERHLVKCDLHGRRVLRLREPGGNPICEDIRAILKKGAALTPVAELLLFSAARSQLVHDVIKPALDNGDIVLCDRFIDSTMAYQYYGNHMDRSLVNTLIYQATGGLEPDFTLWLDIPASVRKARKAEAMAERAEAPDKYDVADDSYAAAVSEGYHKISECCAYRVTKIDATGTVDEVAAKIWDVTYPRLFPAEVSRMEWMTFGPKPAMA